LVDAERYTEAVRVLMDAELRVEGASASVEAEKWYAVDLATVQLAHIVLLNHGQSFDEAEALGMRAMCLVRKKIGSDMHIAACEIPTKALSFIFLQIAIEVAVSLRMQGNAARSVPIIEGFMKDSKDFESKYDGDIDFERTILPLQREMSYIYYAQLNDADTAERLLFDRTERAKDLMTRRGNYDDCRTLVDASNELASFYYDIRQNAVASHGLWAMAHQLLINMVANGFPLDPEMRDILDKINRAVGRTGGEMNNLRCPHCRTGPLAAAGKRPGALQFLAAGIFDSATGIPALAELIPQRAVFKCIQGGKRCSA